MPAPAPVTVDQLDLFGAPAPKIARPTQRSATGVVAKVAARLGYAFCGQCEHCGGFVTLAVGLPWGPAGWLHREAGRNECHPRDLAVRDRFRHIAG